jgi:hypothetical protein
VTSLESFHLFSTPSVNTCYFSYLCSLKAQNSQQIPTEETELLEYAPMSHLFPSAFWMEIKCLYSLRTFRKLNTEWPKKINLALFMQYKK